MRIGVIVATLVAASPVQAQVLTFETGGSATLTANARGGFTIAAQGTDAEWLEPDLVFVRHMRTAQPGPDNMVAAPESDVAPVPIIPGRVTIRFLANRRESILSLQNGLDGGFVYRARIWVQGADQPTDVCLIPPGRRMYEYWPYVIQRIELTAFAHTPWSDGDPVPCV